MLLVGAISVFMLAEPGFAGGSASGTALYGDWPASNVNSNNLNVAPDTQINASNVTTLVNVDPTNALGMIAFDPTMTSLAGVDSAPVVADGIVYVARGGGKVSAYYANGPNVGHPVVGYVETQLTDEDGNPDLFDSSPVITKNAIYMAGRRMHKLDRFTGAELAVHLYNDDINLTSHSGPAQITGSQLMVADDLIIYGTAFNIEASGGLDALLLYPYAHGEIIAFRQSDLSIAWHIDLPSIGPDGKPLPNGQSYGSGMGTFGGFGVDNARKLVFAAIGNQYSDVSQPCFATNTCPVGPLSDSLVAIDYRTGKVVWFYQYTANDAWGSAGLDVGANGKKDLDVHAHPQIFSINLIPGVNLSKIDLVGARAKDGTYRIFTRDQIPGHVFPIAQVQFEPAATFGDGAIQTDPPIKDGIMYIGSTALVKDPSTDPAYFQTLPGYTMGRHTSLDLLGSVVEANDPFGRFAAFQYGTTTLRAIDLRQLIYFGMGRLLQGKKIPVCGIDANLINPNVDMVGNPTCDGLLPNNIVKWTTTLKPFIPLAASGFTYDNGVLIMGNILGFVDFINAQNGALLPMTLVPQPISMFPGAEFLAPLGFQGNVVLGGVAAVNGYLYVPVGIAVGHEGAVSPNPLFAFGGLAIFKLP